MPLYKVSIRHETVVWADSERQAEVEAAYLIREIMTEPGCVIEADLVQTREDLPDDWTGTCLPWGGPADMTVSELMPTRQ